MKKIYLSAGACLIACIFGADAVKANNVSDQTAAPAQAAPNDADIVVTAQRREERLQDVPVSVAAFNGPLLQRLGVTQITDVFAQTPGVKFQTPNGIAGFAVYNIRGVTLLDFSYTNEASVASYADDVYIGNTAALTQQLFDIERVEILRGPQGTLYGRNATGGLVQYISRRPTRQFEAAASAEYGTFQNVVLESNISGPLSDHIRARIAGRFNRNDGWQRNVVTDTRLASVHHSAAVRGTIEADVSNSVLARLSVHYSDTTGSEDGRVIFGKRNPANLSQTCTLQQTLASLCVNAAGFGVPHPDPEIAYSDHSELPYAIKNLGGYFRVEGDLGFAKLTSISAYEYIKKLDEVDADGAAISATNLLIEYYIKHKQYSQELRLNGKTGKLNWLSGAFYYNDNRFFTSDNYAAHIGDYAFQKIWSVGLFAQGTYSITDTLNLTGGVRFTKDHKTLDPLVYVSNPVRGTTLGTPIFTYTGTIAPRKITWRLGADWHLTPDIMLFATAATGFKSGAYNTQIVTSIGAVGPVAPETITTYELGIKSKLIGDMLTANLTGFYNDYKGIQAAVAIPAVSGPSPTQTVFLNIGTAHIEGMELELVARPASDFTVRTGLSLNHNRLFSPPTVAIAGRPLNGNRLANTPRISVNGSADWQPSIHDAGSLLLAADFSFQSLVYFRPDNNPTSVQPAYVLVGARIGWTSPDRSLKIEGFVKNLFDKIYYNHATDLGDYAAYQFGMPRNFGVRVSKTF